MFVPVFYPPSPFFFFLFFTSLRFLISFSFLGPLPSVLFTRCCTYVSQHFSSFWDVSPFPFFFILIKKIIKISRTPSNGSIDVSFIFIAGRLLLLLLLLLLSLI
ncbi:hypothetical protein, unlikely [Trypanosoma brucei gambiense DAL972]|uniref:Uncharacterized protein n=1 Tax=Trypanosoma brucei gambiense (strain MHOM/CI/86/DAL972) TaxID=679716 RepID=C9ZPN9_TRYB9|nr:hypothetical protein, unlikely [Trypanosoma brucei gambiense DAL972]CBH11367.1 hypothetical protein, unlikely [Trypanosoma brucei gambiense DAL972]|eukprot:XP_011773654.1 hypothetical protein, unlikely [Trypanosoma brucei gambiense DAL972]